LLKAAEPIDKMIGAALLLGTSKCQDLSGDLLLCSREGDMGMLAVTDAPTPFCSFARLPPPYSPYEEMALLLILRIMCSDFVSRSRKMASSTASARFFSS